MTTKPPLGVEPWHLWQERHGDNPDLRAVKARHGAVYAAVLRFRTVGRDVPVGWMSELLTARHWHRCRAAGGLPPLA